MMTIFENMRRMARREEGSVAIMAGLLTTVLVPSVVAAVDMTTLTNTKAEVQAHLDSAVLAASRMDDLEEASRDGRIQRIGERFLTNSLNGNGVNVDDMEAVFTYDAEENIVRATVSFDTRTLLVGKVMDIEHLDLVSETKPQEPVELEVALSLDVSGSMGWSLTSNNPAPVGQRRIDVLAEGVEGLVGVLTDNPLIDARISVVPYSTSVNLAAVSVESTDAQTGQTTMTVADPDAADAATVDVDTTWAVENVERNGAGEMKIEDEVKSEIRKTVAEGADLMSMGGEESDYGKSKEEKKKAKKKKSGKSKEEAVEEKQQERMTEEVKPVKTATIGLPKTSVKPLTEPEEIASYLNNIVPEGATAGHIGAEWALYSLLPDWQGTFNHDEPPSEFDGDSRKVLVMMTDGDFTVTHTPGMSIEDAYDVFQDVCRTARDAGIYVYTVGLRASTKTDLELTRCAGDPGRYFPADSREALIKAFEAIGEDATKLRIAN